MISYRENEFDLMEDHKASKGSKWKPKFNMTDNEL